MILFMHNANLRKECTYLKIYLIKFGLHKKLFKMIKGDFWHLPIYTKNYININMWPELSYNTIFWSDIYSSTLLKKYNNNQIILDQYNLYNLSRIKITFISSRLFIDKKIKIRRIYKYIRPFCKKYNFQWESNPNAFWPYTKFSNKK